MADAPFIRYGGNFLVPQPYDLRHVTGSGFAVDGDRKKMQALCDRTLNHKASKTRYRVLSQTVLITFMHMPRLTSALPSEAAGGAFTENELNITLLLAAGHYAGPLFVPERLVWYMPYLWIDANQPMIAGREVYGFPKQYGAISMPRAAGDPAVFCASGELLTAFAPHAVASVQPIVKARRTDAHALEHQDAFKSLDDAVAGFYREALRVTDPLLLAWATLANLSAADLLTLVFLRQLPSISDGARASYQSVAEAGFSPLLERLPRLGFLEGKYEVEILKHDSAPIAAELGFAATNGAGDALLHPHAAYFVDIDFTLHAGREIWVAS